MDLNRNASAVAFQRYNVRSPMDDPMTGSSAVMNTHEHLDGGNPLSAGQNTFGTVASFTAWRAGHGADKPLSYSSQTRGTTINFDDPTQRPTELR
jgi:hypothetical protein